VPQVTKTKEKIVYQENTAKLAIKDNIIYNLNKSVHEHLKKIDELKKSNESLIKFRNIVLGIMFVIVLATFIIAFIQAKRLW
jgi:hypothetical protein